MLVATSIARRVLPIPPMPRSDTTECATSDSPTAFRSVSRPKSGVESSGTPAKRASRSFAATDVCRSATMLSWRTRVSSLGSTPNSSRASLRNSSNSRSAPMRSPISVRRCSSARTATSSSGSCAISRFASTIAECALSSLPPYGRCKPGLLHNRQQVPRKSVQVAPQVRERLRFRLVRPKRKGRRLALDAAHGMQQDECQQCHGFGRDVRADDRSCISYFSATQERD